MTKIKLYVGLKIPDTTAITAFHALQRLGYNQLKKLLREEYYEFNVLKDEEQFMKDIVKVDVLVNANKHYARIFKENEEEKDEFVQVLVKSVENDCAGLFSTLRERMGFIHLNSMSKGILWKMQLDANKEESKKIAEKITKNLLYNEHYQEYRVI